MLGGERRLDCRDYKRNPVANEFEQQHLHIYTYIYRYTYIYIYVYRDRVIDIDTYADIHIYGHALRGPAQFSAIQVGV